jgi:hypothetical protein
MKLKEIIENIDKSKKNSSYIDVQELARQEFDIQIGYEQELNRITAYYFLKWYCTDSYVGGRAYFLDDKFIAISSQTGRKMNEDFIWVSQEAFSETKKYILTLIEEQVDREISPLDMEEEWGIGAHISYSSQLLTDKVVFEPTGEKVDVVETYHSVGDIKSWSTVKIKFENGKEEIVNMKNILVPYDVVIKSKQS